MGTVKLKPRKRVATMALTTSIADTKVNSNSIDRSWIVTELVKEIAVERTLASDAKSRAEAPPDPAIGVLLHEISADDERHACAIERIATRFGHVPTQCQGNQISQALGHLKEKIVELSRSPMDQLTGDLAAKARSVQWLTAWFHTFEEIGESESAREISVVLIEERAHLDALQQSFNHLVEDTARGSDSSNGDERLHQG